MADLQSQLQAILGDAETMSQITAIAQALTGGQAQDPPPSTAGQESLSAELAALRDGGKQKSYEFRERMGKKLTNTEILLRLEQFGLHRTGRAADR